jgi:hypothetical protein
MRNEIEILRTSASDPQFVPQFREQVSCRARRDDEDVAEYVEEEQRSHARKPPKKCGSNLGVEVLGACRRLRRAPREDAIADSQAAESG